MNALVPVQREQGDSEDAPPRIAMNAPPLALVPVQREQGDSEDAPPRIAMNAPPLALVPVQREQGDSEDAPPRIAMNAPPLALALGDALGSSAEDHQKTKNNRNTRQRAKRAQGLPQPTVEQTAKLEEQLMASRTQMQRQARDSDRLRQTLVESEKKRKLEADRVGELMKQLEAATERYERAETEIARLQGSRDDSTHLDYRASAITHATARQEFLIKEREMLADADYLDRHRFVTQTHRATLVDWMIDVHHRHQLTHECLHRAVHIMDRYVSCSVEIQVMYLKLVGAAALLVTGVTSSAQVMPKDKLSRDLLNDMNNAFAHSDLQAMFNNVVKVLKERPPLQTACDRVDWLCKMVKTPDDGIAQLAHFTADRALQEYKLLKYTPTRIAAAALLVARTRKGWSPAWNDKLFYFSMYDVSDLVECAQDLNDMLDGLAQDPPTLTAVKRKYQYVENR